MQGVPGVQRKSLATISAAVVALGASVVGAASLWPRDGAPDECRAPFSATSPWNVPIEPGASYDPHSPEYVASMDPEHRKLTSDPAQYTFPVYEVTSDTPTRPVRYSGWHSRVTSAGTKLENFRPPDPSQRVVWMPVPPDAVAAAGSDAQVIIVNRDTGDEWDASHFDRADAGYRAWNVGRYNVDWSGVPPYDESGDPYWNRGSGVPYLAGLVRPCEIERGRIDHALAFAYPMTTPEWRHPATRSDGQNPAGAGMPQGARLQLDPAIVDSTIREAWGCTDACFTIAKALQRHGMYLIDGSGRPKIMVEYEATAHWDGAITASTASPIPLAAFRVLAPVGN